MKRIAIAALAALTAVSLTACGNKDKNDDSGWFTPVENPTDVEETVQTDRPLVVVEGVPEAGQTSAAEQEEDRIVIELTEPDGQEGGKTTESGKKNVTQTQFTFTADEEIWTVERELNSTSIIYNKDDIDFAMGNCSIMINTRVIEDMPERTLGEVADAIVDSKGLTDLLEITDRGESVLGGHDAYTLTGIYTVGDVSFDLDITVMAEGMDVMEVWVMSYEECTEAMQENFDDVLNTIEFGA